MTIITDALVPAANTTNIINTSKKLMLMFDGHMPTKAEFEAAMYSTIKSGNVRGQYNLQNFTTWAAGLGATCRAHCFFPATTPVHHMGPTKIRFPFSAQPEEFTKLSSGTVTWFAVMTVLPSATIWNLSAVVYWIGIGDVGDVGSNADLILPGTAITDVDALKANDLIFNYSGF